MKIREIMTTDLITLRSFQTIGEAVSIFIKDKIDGAPVLDDNGKLVGLFTKSHIYRAVDKGMDLATKVEELMTKRILTAYPDDEFGDVVNSKVPRLPVVDKDGKLVGIVTRGDIAIAFFDSYSTISLEYDTIINSVHNVIVSIDKKGMIKVWNSSAERLLGQKANDVIGKSFLKVLPESDLVNIVKSGKEDPIKKVELNGHTFISNRSPIKKDGQIIGAVAVMQDISEVDKISKELHNVKELNDAIVESSHDGLVVVDCKGSVLRYNKAFERLTGISSQEYLGRSVEDIKKDKIISDPVSSHVLKQKKPITIMQESKLGKHLLTTGTPIFDKKGEITRVVCNTRDITELDLLRQKLEQVENLTQHYESQIRTLKMQYTGNEKMVITSNKMKNLIDRVIRVAAFESTVLITGESGTGKELIAEIIHANSLRKNKPFIKVNCGAIPENLLESELFGYEGGAFTGAKKQGKVGYIEMAEGGTLFLDEIGEVPLNLQVKLLRFLQGKEIIRVGGESFKKVDVRIISATNRDLLEMVEKKQFRDDLYYRLNVVPVRIPSLRNRKEDIPALVAHFLQIFNRKYNMSKRISPGVVNIFMQYDWPGNVRELENLIEQLVVITFDNIINIEELPPHLRDTLDANSSSITVSGIIPLRTAIESVEKQLLEKVYAKNKTTREMAKELEVDASTIVRKAAKYHIVQIKNSEDCC